MIRMLLCVALLAPLAGAAEAGAAPKAELVSCVKIWDGAPHNAFTNLIRYKDEWFCVFREGAGHVSPDGALRVIVSGDGEQWAPAARLTSETADLRDAQITVTPDNRLMLSGAAAWHTPSPATHQTLAYFSENGRDWTAPVEIGLPNDWLWRVTWNGDTAWGIGYACGRGERNIRLYKSADGRKFDVVVDSLMTEGFPNESSILFLEDGKAVCLLRRDEANGMVGKAAAPYTDWTWKDLGVRIGGPHFIRVPGAGFVAAVRLYEPARTALCLLDPDTGAFSELLTLPSGGDTSYPGLVWHDGLLWVSYYSSHEGKTAIYLARVRFSG